MFFSEPISYMTDILIVKKDYKGPALESLADTKKYKLDMGKSCIRFKNINKIPYELIGELVAKITAQEWVEAYESVIKR